MRSLRAIGALQDKIERAADGCFGSFVREFGSVPANFGAFAALIQLDENRAVPE